MLLIQVSFSIQSSKLSSLQVTGLSFLLSGIVPFSQSLKKRGRRLNATREQRLTPTYAPDQSLLVKVRAPKPSLKIQLKEGPLELFTGEERKATLILQNVGSVSLQDLRVLVEDPSAFQVLDQDFESKKENVETASVFVRNDLDGEVPIEIELPMGKLEAGASLELQVAFRGVSAGLNEARCLFVYEVSYLEKGSDFTRRLTPSASFFLPSPKRVAKL